MPEFGSHNLGVLNNKLGGVNEAALAAETAAETICIRRDGRSGSKRYALTRPVTQPQM